MNFFIGLRNGLPISLALWGMILCVVLHTCSPAKAEEPKVTLQLTSAQVNVLWNLLQKSPMPWEVSNPLLTEIQRQVNEQNKPKEEK